MWTQLELFFKTQDINKFINVMSGNFHFTSVFLSIVFISMTSIVQSISKGNLVMYGPREISNQGIKSCSRLVLISKKQVFSMNNFDDKIITVFIPR